MGEVRLSCVCGGLAVTSCVQCAGFIWLYGSGAQLKLVELISDLESQHKRLLGTLPQAMQEHYWARHKEASGGDAGTAGRWSFPSPIYNEAGFRAMLLEHETLAGGPGQAH